jgi:hypothetical protein
MVVYRGWNPIANSMSVWGALGFIIVGMIASFVEIIRNKKNVFVWLVFILFSGLAEQQADKDAEDAMQSIKL